jgi:hypothetical protein
MHRWLPRAERVRLQEGCYAAYSARGGRTVTTIELFWRSLGLLLRERLHIITAGTVRATGVTCRWEQDLTPIGERAVAAGELVELHVTLDKQHPIADTAKIRFDFLEFDWLFCGGSTTRFVPEADHGRPPGRRLHYRRAARHDGHDIGAAKPLPSRSALGN